MCDHLLSKIAFQNDFSTLTVSCQSKIHFCHLLHQVVQKETYQKQGASFFSRKKGRFLYFLCSVTSRRRENVPNSHTCDYYFHVENQVQVKFEFIDCMSYHINCAKHECVRVCIILWICQIEGSLRCCTWRPKCAALLHSLILVTLGLCSACSVSRIHQGRK